MSYLESVNLLKAYGLEDHFDEDNLKKAYRAAVKATHTDIHAGITDEAIKDINEAHKVLKDSLKNKLTYAEQKEKELRGNLIGVDISSEIFVKYFKEGYERIEQFISENISKEMSVEQVNEAVRKIKKFRRAEYKKIVQRYCEDFDIGVFYSEKFIDYRYSFNVFMAMLENLGEKCSKKAILKYLEKKFDEIILSYQNYAGFEEIKAFFETLKEQLLKRFQKDDNVDMYEEEFKVTVENIYEKYLDNKRRIEQVEEYLKPVEGVVDEEFLKIREMLNDIKEDFKNGFVSEQKLVEIESKMLNSRKKRDLIFSFEEVINKYKERMGFHDLLPLINSQKDFLVSAYNERVDVAFLVNVLQGHIDNYFRQYSRLNDCLDKIGDLLTTLSIGHEEDTDKVKESLLTEFDEFQKAYFKGEFKGDFEQKVQELEKKVEQYKVQMNSKRATKEALEVSQEILPIVFENFNNAKSEFVARGDRFQVEQATKVFQQAIEIIHGGEKGDISTECIKNLAELTFKDFIQDVILLSNVRNGSRISPYKDQAKSDNIFMKRDGLVGLFEADFSTLVEEDGQYYMVGVSNFFKTEERVKVSIRDVVKYYISIDAFLDLAKFDGSVYQNKASNSKVLLYQLNALGLVLGLDGEISVDSLYRLEYISKKEGFNKYCNPLEAKAAIKETMYNKEKEAEVKRN